MTLKPVDVGFMRLYSYIRPALEAGTYRIDMDQEIAGGTGKIPGVAAPSSMAVPRVSRTIDVVGPRFSLPGPEIHSVFPPPNAVGPFHNRLPHIALKRRTLPWERDPEPDGSGDIATRPPWLALVLLTDGEANFMRGVDIKDAMPDEVYQELKPAPGTCDAIEVTTDVVRETFPREGDFEYLVHVRQVNVNDTENAGDDEDGFMSVIMANRLPQKGNIYGVYLISLEGRYPDLPDDNASDFVDDIGKTHVYQVPFEDMVAASYTKGTAAGTVPMVATNQPTSAKATKGAQVSTYPSTEILAAGGSVTETRKSGWHEAADRSIEATASVAATVGEPAATTGSAKATAAMFGQGFLVNDIDFDVLAPQATKIRFPVLAHWQFTSSDGLDFRELMSGLDVGMLGTPLAGDRTEDADFPVVADTGHTLVTHTTRGGVQGEAWYRGPFTPRQVARRAADVPYHTADQARSVGGDGIEALAEAGAFEVGRMMALADPSFLQEVLRWRREGFRLLRAAGLLDKVGLTDLLLDDLYATNLGRKLGAAIFSQLAVDDVAGLGPLIDPVAELGLLEQDAEVIAAGFNTTRTRVKTAFGEGPGLTTPGLDPGFDTGPDVVDFDELVRIGSDELAHLGVALDAEVQTIKDGVFLPDKDFLGDSE